ncbi:hypothetical protein LSH36_1373g00000 [Paralvinella palmiformis]|uniref:Glycosyl hydrolase family 13 catalytic domain-containing protein n=1 Tax=Paralvinella palmiformis TaxID=53620 RepID=A0AAD9MNF3_9ANNE|nr:hypothetical protein LSH36_1373g00000 [Paralvinella palmiformis]
MSEGCFIFHLASSPLEVARVFEVRAQQEPVKQTVIQTVREPLYRLLKKMDNLAVTVNDEDEKKRFSEISSKSWKSDVNNKYEVFRYSAEKKALEGLDSCITAVSLGSVIPADKPYAGMGKEDLMRFSQTPFWNRFRLACTIMFWLAWATLLGAVIGLIVTFPQCTPPPEKPWYETAVIYQIYVRSFYDSDGDGAFASGIRSKLDYLTSIDTDAILLSSIYDSHPDESDGGDGPADYGYEVTNHTQIYSPYGTMKDFDILLTEAHERGIKVIMDFIPNYTGSNHTWFIESKRSRNISNPYWNFYVWLDCDKQPPNNWLSVYSESMWSDPVDRDPGSKQCYLHQFLNSQPELNLRSSAVQEKLEEILRFWLNKGVDGFRIVKVKHLFEDADFRDEPHGQCTDRYECYDHKYTTSQDDIYPLVSRWREIVDEYSQDDGVPRILLTDAMDNIANSLLYYGDYGSDGAHLPLNYQLTQINTSCNGRCMYEVMDSWLYGTPTYGTMNWMTGTQDMRRLADVIPQTDWNDWGYQNAIIMWKMTLPGAAFIYYGEEIGMTSVNNTGDQGSRDPAGNISLAYSRDPYRSPMQWTNGTSGGFMNVTLSNSTLDLDPWLEPGDNLLNISVEAQNGTDFTPFMFYSELTELRRTSETFLVGNFHYTLLTDDVVSYYREYEGKDRYVVAIKFGSGDEPVDIAGSHYDVPDEAEVVMTTRAGMSVSSGDMANLKELSLKTGDGVIVKWPYVRPDGKKNS